MHPWFHAGFYRRTVSTFNCLILAAMSGAFSVTMETLMGPEEPERRSKRNDPDLLNNPDDRRLWKRLQQIKSLPERDQRAILRMLDNTITANAGDG